MGKISVEIPGEIIHSARMDTTDIKRELALLLYQQKKISFGKARELAELSVWSFQSLLGERRIPVNYDVEDFDRDLHNLKELGRI